MRSPLKALNRNQSRFIASDTNAEQAFLRLHKVITIAVLT